MKFSRTFLFLFLTLSALDALARDQCAELGRAIKVVEELRGLKLQEQVRCKSLSRQEFRSVSDEYLFELVALQTLADLGKLYKALGLISESFDFAHCYLQETSSYAQAFYHIFDNVIYLPDWQNTPFDMLVHEVVHALQDQYFPLEAHARRVASNTDQSMGFMAIIEGDARRLQSKYIEQHPVENDPSDQNELSVQRDNPCKFSEQLESIAYFPYEYGERFVRDLSDQQIADFLESPPTSSTAIIHPHLKLSAKTEIPPYASPIFGGSIEADDLPRWQIKDQIGQYVIRMILEQFVGPKEAVLASIGWRGDSAYFYERPNASLMSWTTIWTSDEDAKEFRLAFEKVATARSTPSRKYHIDQQANKIYISSVLKGPNEKER